MSRRQPSFRGSALSFASRLKPSGLSCRELTFVDCPTASTEAVSVRSFVPDTAEIGTPIALEPAGVPAALRAVGPRPHALIGPSSARPDGHSVRPRRLAAVAAATLIASFTTAASAATLFWEGEGPTADWSSVSTTPGSTFGRSNWGLPFALPRIGDDLVFGKPHNTVNHNDLTNLTSIRNLTFSDTAGPFTLTGGALGITGIVSNLGDSLQTLDLPLTALQSGTWSGGTGGIDITGPLSVGDLSLVLKDRVSVRNAGKSLIVGAQQSGSLSLRSGSSLVAGTATLGVAEGSAGTLSLNGSDVSAETEFLGLGQGGDGVLFLGSGATMTASNVVYGASSTGTGSIHVTGSGSRLSVGDDISPGWGGGSMSIDSGGIVSARSLYVAGGETVGSSFRILHAGSELISENLIQVDGATGGDSQLTVTSGGVVRYSGTERIDPRNPFGPPAGLQVGYSFSEGSAGVLTISGAGSRVEGSAPLGVGRSGTGRLTVQSGGYLRSGTSSIAPLLSTASGVVTVTGADSRWESEGDLSIGAGGSGELVVREGGEVSAPNVVLGKNFTGRGRVSVAGAGSTFSVMSGLQVGAIGTGTLEVLDGGSVSVGGAMSIAAHGVVSLTGGQLSAGSFTAAGQFQWNTGTFRITGSGGASLGTTLPSVLVLHDGMQLRVDHALSVGTGSVLVLGGGTASAGTFALAGGTIIAGASPFDLAGNQILWGQGTVVGRVTGSAGSHVIADGTLTLGDATRADGFAYGGWLDVGSQQVILLASGKARPGAEVSLGEGGRLSAVNGMHLGAGDTLRFQGNASILGLFFNDGEVDGGGGRLSFLNDVSGAGSFGGDIVFHAGYSPGNSPAVVDFGDGNAIFDATAELTMEIGGSTPGTEYDQLVGIDQFVFNGTLQLVFGSNYAPITDDRLSLFSFRSFSGSFAPERIHVVGFDRSRLDFSRLASTGELAVSAPVPEPATYVLSFVGFGLLYWRARIRGSRPTTV